METTIYNQSVKQSRCFFQYIHKGSTSVIHSIYAAKRQECPSYLNIVSNMFHKVRTVWPAKENTAFRYIKQPIDISEIYEDFLRPMKIAVPVTMGFCYHILRGTWMIYVDQYLPKTCFHSLQCTLVHFIISQRYFFIELRVVKIGWRIVLGFVLTSCAFYFFPGTICLVFATIWN